jgi:hypothetical protein
VRSLDALTAMYDKAGRGADAERTRAEARAVEEALKCPEAATA